jgi:hypothetical protein
MERFAAPTFARLGQMDGAAFVRCSFFIFFNILVEFDDRWVLNFHVYLLLLLYYLFLIP